jgi:hypothetical protein
VIGDYGEEAICIPEEFVTKIVVRQKGPLSSFQCSVLPSEDRTSDL